MTAKDFELELAKNASNEYAVGLQRFFKTGPGQYGEGDVFIGVRMPDIRMVCKKFGDLPLREVQTLIESPVHEHRMAGLIILTNKYPKAEKTQKQEIYNLYMDRVYAGNVNNWDLVDVTTPKIIGAHLLSGDRKILYDLASSQNLWQRRVAVLATFAFIGQGDASTSMDLAKKLLDDKHDLMHKAVGWMLREVGKRVDEKILTDFLDRHATEMPRTMLRYSIERLSPSQRSHYMSVR